MTKSDYESRHWAAQMKLWKEYKSCSVEKLMSVVEECQTLNRQVSALEMQARGGHNIIIYAMSLCSHKKFKLREMGAFILGQVSLPDSKTVLETIEILISLISKEKSIRVRYTAVYSLGHRCAKGFTNYKIIMPVLKKAADDHIASVRKAVAFSLAHIVNPSAIPLLEQLLLDSDEDVRNWAAFAVNNSKADSSKIRDALAKMLDDSFEDARLEAISALAYLQDKRVIPVLKHELEKETLVLSVVESVADFGDPEFLPILEGLLKKFNDNEGVIELSIEKLKKWKTETATRSSSSMTTGAGWPL